MSPANARISDRTQPSGMAKRGGGRAAVENFRTFFLTRLGRAANRSLVKTTCPNAFGRSLPFRVADLPEQQPVRLTIDKATRS